MQNILTKIRFIAIAVPVILALFVTGVSTQVGFAASFSCDHATTAVEKMICSNPELSQLDEKLAATYREALEKLPQKRESLRVGQRQWLIGRNKCSDALCIENAYKSRLADLKLIASKPASEKADKLQQTIKPTNIASVESGVIKKYPPYPDVWEREYFDYLEDGTLFVPINTGEVIIGSDIKVDRNGGAVKGDKGNLIYLKGVLTFFEGVYILDPYEKFSIVKGQWAYGKKPDYYEETHSYATRHFKSKDIPITGGSKINWIVGLALDRYNKYGMGASKKEEIDGIQIDSKTFYVEDVKSRFVQHTMYYIKPVILEKKDNHGKVLWQKVYIYFHPWWASYMGEGGADAYSFFYFKQGFITVIDEDRIFLHFDGTNKIFRLDKDGNPRTKDKNLLVMNYKTYKSQLSGVVSSIDAVREDIFKTKSYIEPCDISMGEGKDFYFMEDYDFFGEQLSQRFGIDINSKEVKDIMSKPRGLDQCIKNYNKLKTMRGGYKHGSS